MTAAAGDTSGRSIHQSLFPRSFPPTTKRNGRRQGRPSAAAAPFPILRPHAQPTLPTSRRQGRPSNPDVAATCSASTTPSPTRPTPSACLSLSVAESRVTLRLCRRWTRRSFDTPPIVPGSRTSRLSQGPSHSRARFRNSWLNRRSLGPQSFFDTIAPRGPEWSDCVSLVGRLPVSRVGGAVPPR